MRSIIKASCFCLVLGLACASGFLYGKHTSLKTHETAAASSLSMESDPLDAFRTERQQLRQMQLSQLNEIIHSSSSESEIIFLAQQRQLELMEWTEQEMTLEGILSIRGFDNPVVTVHTDSVNVMVSAETISQQDASVILELVMRETGISGGNVKIMPVK